VGPVLAARANNDGYDGSNQSSGVAYIDWHARIGLSGDVSDALLRRLARRLRAADAILRLLQLGDGTLPAPLFLFLAGVSVAPGHRSQLAAGIAASRIARSTMLRGMEVFGFAFSSACRKFLLGQPWAPWTDILRVDVLNIIGLSIVF